MLSALNVIKKNLPTDQFLEFFTIRIYLMKKIYLFLAVTFAAVSILIVNFQTSAESNVKHLANANFVSQNVVIYQIYGGGGLSTAQYKNDFVVLFNRGNSSVNLNGWSTQYASSGGNEWLVTPLSDVFLEPGQYYLIQYASNGSVGDNLPTPDLFAPVVTNNSGNSFVPNLSSTDGKLALVNTTQKLPLSTCPSEPSIIDLVGFGNSASCFEGRATNDISRTTAIIRKNEGCKDSDDNFSDFVIAAPAPRNTVSARNTCNVSANLEASGGASPSTVAAGGNTLLTVRVFPAASPPSTGISVEANLVSIGGAANQNFFDDGTNGDQTANDNIFSYLATIPENSGGGQTTVTATATDAQARSATAVITLTINAPIAGENPLLLGNPSNATADVANENNYLMNKPQYSLSYNRSRATANWVGWRLDSSWIGNADRQDDFRPDPQLPSGWYQVTSSDYTGSGYDRGHMTPSGDRTRSIPDNSATFLMTNIIPQLAANNQGAWNDFENYLRSVVSQGNEIYIFSGVAGNAGTIAQGKIVVPESTWKVALILPNGDNDLQRISKSTRTIAIVVPNQPPLSIGTPWRNFRTTINAVEFLTGYDFFSKIPKNTQEIIERRRDLQ